MTGFLFYLLRQPWPGPVGVILIDNATPLAAQAVPMVDCWVTGVTAANDP